jgi:hypothetical protein
LAIRWGRTKKFFVPPVKMAGDKEYVSFSTQSDRLNEVVCGGSRRALSCNANVGSLLEVLKSSKQQTLVTLKQDATEGGKAALASSVASRAVLCLYDTESEPGGKIDDESSRRRTCAQSSSLQAVLCNEGKELGDRTS